MALAGGVIQSTALPRLTDLVRSVTAPSTLTNPFSASGTLTALSGGKPAYGLKWSAQSAPAGAGRATRSIVFYEQEWLSLSMHYVFADASDFIGDSVLTRAAEGFVLFEFGQPTDIDYSILAGWTVNFAWLVAP